MRGTKEVAQGLPLGWDSLVQATDYLNERPPVAGWDVDSDHDQLDRNPAFLKTVRCSYSNVPAFPNPFSPDEEELEPAIATILDILKSGLARWRFFKVGPKGHHECSLRVAAIKAASRPGRKIRSVDGEIGAVEGSLFDGMAFSHAVCGKACVVVVEVQIRLERRIDPERQGRWGVDVADGC